jgi:non-ribosomal peptide synthetase component F
MVGLFINTLPARVHIDKDASWPGWLQNLQDTLVNLSQYEYTPLADIHGWSQVPRTLPLFDSVVVIENYPMDISKLQEHFTLEVSIFRATMSRNNLPLTVRVVPGHSLHLQLMYDQARFAEDEIQRMLTHFEIMLKQTADLIERPIHTLINLLADADQETLAQKAQSFKAASSQKLKKVRRKTAVK